MSKGEVDLEPMEGDANRIQLGDRRCRFGTWMTLMRCPPFERVWVPDDEREGARPSPAQNPKVGDVVAEDQFANTCEDRRLREAGFFVCGSNADREWHWHGPDRKWHDGYRSEYAAVRAALKALAALRPDQGARAGVEDLGSRRPAPPSKSSAAAALAHELDDRLDDRSRSE